MSVFYVSFYALFSNSMSVKKKNENNRRKLHDIIYSIVKTFYGFDDASPKTMFVFSSFFKFHLYIHNYTRQKIILKQKEKQTERNKNAFEYFVGGTLFSKVRKCLNELEKTFDSVSFEINSIITESL